MFFVVILAVGFAINLSSVMHKRLFESFNACKVLAVEFWGLTG
jgi:hypothetical protein